MYDDLIKYGMQEYEKYSRADLKITPENIQVVSPSAVFLSRNIENTLNINEARNEVTFFANFNLLKFEDGKYFITEIRTDRFLTMKYDKLEKNTSKIFFLFPENSNLFKDNLSVNSVSNAYSTFNLLLSGKLNEVLNSDYKDLPKIVKKILSDNEIKGFKSINFEVLIAEISRLHNDPTIPARKVATINSTSRDFRLINIREVPRNVSSFSAVTAENIGTGITSSILNTKLGVKKQLTPIEAISLQ